MTAGRLAAALTGLLLAGCSGGPASLRAPPMAGADMAERRLLVMVADPRSGGLDLRGARSGAYHQARAYAGSPPRVTRMFSKLAEKYGMRHVEGWPMRSLGIHCGVFEAGPDTSLDALVAALGADEQVESVQRMQQFEVRESRTGEPWDDPYHSLQHSLEESGVTQAHRWVTGRGVRVAVIDTGVDTSHPDLRGQAIEVQSFVSGGAGTRDRHGTAIAGVIASVAGNRQGIVGVAPGAKLLALQACTQRDGDGRGLCTSFSLARALDHAIGAGSDVINLSLGGPRDALLERLLAAAVAREIVVVAARGNGGASPPFPATLSGVVAVGDELSRADATLLIAPGHEVLTLVPAEGYDFLSGSSIAAAHVSGIVALLLERKPALRAADVEPLLARTSRPVGRDGERGRMLVSACGALAELSAAVECTAAAVPRRAAKVTPESRPLETH